MKLTQDSLKMDILECKVELMKASVNIRITCFLLLDKLEVAKRDKYFIEPSK